MQSLAVPLNICKTLVPGWYQWLLVFPAVSICLVLWRKELWRAGGLLEKGGENVLDVVFRQLLLCMRTDLLVTFGVLMSTSAYMLLSGFVFC